MSDENLEQLGYKKELIVFRDDNDIVKRKFAYVRAEDNGFWIVVETSNPFWINSTQMLKRKPRGDKDE